MVIIFRGERVKIRFQRGATPRRRPLLCSFPHSFLLLFRSGANSIAISLIAAPEDGKERERHAAREPFAFSGLMD